MHPPPPQWMGGSTIPPHGCPWSVFPLYFQIICECGSLDFSSVSCPGQWSPSSSEQGGLQAPTLLCPHPQQCQPWVQRSLAGPYCGSVDPSTRDTESPSFLKPAPPTRAPCLQRLSAARHSHASPRPILDLLRAGRPSSRDDLAAPLAAPGPLSPVPDSLLWGPMSSSSLVFSHSCCLLTSPGSTLEGKPPGTWHTLSCPDSTPHCAARPAHTLAGSQLWDSSAVFWLLPF